MWCDFALTIFSVDGMNFLRQLGYWYQYYKNTGSLL